ncbi:glycoside hydrolase family 16 protein [Goodfellowiella coeruleoviolacea]|uniref:Beta-glucanase, GH16 family n=1 Tax=Goodfellowiella coeruleoviolacea TaxID=334858 RepID=A0AAE3GII3_9PSEU|nr:glycoside hydrolase family 16 protein [Goodfellowiella coeruleoviolacea]MCP2168258.1 Beta-glucanase, GH16 family [Goodfellowiella coeruleoviolacea]
METPPPRPSHRRLLAVGSALLSAAALVGAAVFSANAAEAPAVAPLAVPAPPAGFNLVWSDDFTGAAGSRLDSSKWLYDIGTSYPGGAPNWGTGEIERMTDSTANVYQDGAGRLAIKPIRDAAGNWTSGRVETQRTDFQPPAGGKLRIESSIQLPNVTGAQAQGIWPAFWALGAPFRGVYTNWPSVGEIDVMENVNGANQVWGTLHCGVSPGGPCNETTGLGGSRVMGSPSLQQAFHTYAVEWDRGVSPEQLRWYVDGVQYHAVSANQVDATTWANATNHGFFVILNVAIGGGWPGMPTSATASGVPMLVDYVAVYSTAGGTQPTTTTPGNPGGGVDAYGTIQAESPAESGNVTTGGASDTGGGQALTQVGNGGWARYNKVNFGSTAATQFVGRVASGAATGVSGLVEVRLDSRTATPIGSFAIASTGGWQTWKSVPANISGVTGTHDVYLTFTSGQPAAFVSLNWFTFGR